MRHNATQNFSNEHETIRKYNRSALAPMSQKWQAKKRVVERWRRKTTKRFLRPDTRAAIKGRHKKAPTRIVAEGQTEVKSSRWRCYLQMMHSYSSVLFFSSCPNHTGTSFISFVVSVCRRLWWVWGTEKLSWRCIEALSLWRDDRCDAGLHEHWWRPQTRTRCTEASLGSLDWSPPVVLWSSRAHCSSCTSQANASTCEWSWSCIRTLVIDEFYTRNGHSQTLHTPSPLSQQPASQKSRLLWSKLLSCCHYFHID